MGPLKKEDKKDDIEKIVEELKGQMTFLQEMVIKSLPKEHKVVEVEQKAVEQKEELVAPIIPDPTPMESYAGYDGVGSVTKPKKLFEFGWCQKRDLNKNPTTTFIATMLYGNGTCDHFVIKTKEQIFYWKNRYYHLNKNKVFYDVNCKQNRLFYYEDYVEPLDTNIYAEGDKAFLKITPSNLKSVFEMEYVKVISQSQQLTKWIKIAVYLIIANLFFTGIMVLIMIVQSGIFSKLSLAAGGGC
jgi:hypothetical protein